MSLRGVKPTTVKKRLKALLYGDAGVGKTTVTLSFPAPYLIDTEDGATYPEYTDALDRAGGAYFATSSFDEIVKEVRELMNARHNYRTLIIDSVSVVYDDLCTRTISEIAARGEDPMAFQRYRQEADRKFRQVTNLLKLLDMNVIMTAHETVKWQNGKEVGRTFDGYKKSNHFFDLMLKLERRGRERVAIVEKTRIAGFPDGSTFPATYAEFAVRYGAEAMERAAESVALVAPEDATRIRQLAKRLMKSARVEKTAVEAALAKAGASKIDDLSAEHAAKLEAWLESRRAVETEEQPVEA